MKKIGVVSLILVLVAMTMGCGILFGNLNGTWKGEVTEFYEGVPLTVKCTLELDDPLFKMTMQTVVPEGVKEYLSPEDLDMLTQKYEGTYTYDKKNKLITFRDEDDSVMGYAHVDGKEMNMGDGLILKKQ